MEKTVMFGPFSLAAAGQLNVQVPSAGRREEGADFQKLFQQRQSESRPAETDSRQPQQTSSDKDTEPSQPEQAQDSAPAGQEDSQTEQDGGTVARTDGTMQDMYRRLVESGALAQVEAEYAPEVPAAVPAEAAVQEVQAVQTVQTVQTVQSVQPEQIVRMEQTVQETEPEQTVQVLDQLPEVQPEAVPRAERKAEADFTPAEHVQVSAQGEQETAEEVQIVRQQPQEEQQPEQVGTEQPVQSRQTQTRVQTEKGNAQTAEQPQDSSSDREETAVEAERAPQPVFRDVETVPIKVGEAPRAEQTQEVPAETQVGSALVQALEQGETRVELQLTPENLGTVKVEITHSQAGIHVSLTAQNPQTRTLLEKHSEDLQSLLAGRTQDNVRVEVQKQEQSQRQDNHPYDGHSGHSQNQQQQEQRRHQSPESTQDFLARLRLGLAPLDEE